MEERPERRGTPLTSNPYIHLQTTVLAIQAWGVTQHMVKQVKPSFGCYLPSLEIGQGTSSLESPPWMLGAPSRCHLSGEESKMPGWGADPQHMSKQWCPNPSSIWHPSSLSPFLAREADPAGALAVRVAVGQGAGPQLRVGLLQLPPRCPSTHHREKIPQAKEEGKCC